MLSSYTKLQLVKTNKNEENRTMKKRVLALALSGLLTISVLAGCGNTTQESVVEDSVAVETTEQASTEEGVTEISSEEVAAADTVDESFVLEYPADLQNLGFTEPIVLEKTPERVVALSAEEHKVAMEAAYAKNEAYWNSIEAVKNGDVIYLPVTYCSTAGINVIDNINALMDTVAEFYGVELN